jgi:hypothetical protein
LVCIRKTLGREEVAVGGGFYPFGFHPPQMIRKQGLGAVLACHMGTAILIHPPFQRTELPHGQVGTTLDQLPLLLV